MKILTLFDCEVVSGGFRINPRSPVDCVPFEDVAREDAVSFHSIRGLGGLPLRSTVDPVASPIAFAKPNPQVASMSFEAGTKIDASKRETRLLTRGFDRHIEQ